MPTPLETAADGAANRIQLWARLLRTIEATSVVEVGVFRGEFAMKILRRVASIERYYLVDPWRHLDNWNKPANRGSEEFEGYYDETVSRTDFAGSRRVFLRGTTTEVADEVPDGSLDFAYIDGDHTLKGIAIDLSRWYPKVRDGGWIGGDDFTPRLWQHGYGYDPTFVFPYAVYFAEAMGIPIHGLRFNQFAMEKRPKAGFSFSDTVGKYRNLDLQTLLGESDTKQGRPGRTRPDAVRAPVFIVGCGRSGTTALGEALGQHPGVAYFNEPRAIWRRDPRTDIWSRPSGADPRLVIDDVAPEIGNAIRAAFAARAPQDAVIVEKTPINAFRIGFLRAVYPNARILHLVRNGQDVARSIARHHADRGRWYGDNDAKWTLLAAHASRAGLAELAQYCAGDSVRRGLLEWRLAVTAARHGLNAEDLEVRYEDLMRDPGGTLTQIAAWAGLDPAGFPSVDLERRSPTVTAVDAEAQYIAGDLLRELGYSS